jgi:hypothetical protein
MDAIGTNAPLTPAGGHLLHTPHPHHQRIMWQQQQIWQQHQMQQQQMQQMQMQQQRQLPQHQ